MTVRRTFPPVPQSVAASRHWVTRVLREAGCASVVENAELLVSELASNAVAYARTPFEVAVECLDGAVRIEVLDEDPVVPSPSPTALDAASGRGLAIVEAVAEDWAAEPEAPTGKKIWFELPLPTGSD